MVTPWNHNVHYHGLVMNSVPPNSRLALDVGCGRGLLAQQIAQATGMKVIGIDTDKESLLAAEAATNVSWVQGDVMTYPLESASFDFIAAVATLHHLPLIPALSRFRDLLRPGGVLAIIGLYRAETLADFSWSAAGLPASRVLRLLHHYESVGAPLHAPEQTIAEVRTACHDLLPGAVLRRRLLFRYSLIWNKPR